MIYQTKSTLWHDQTFGWQVLHHVSFCKITLAYILGMQLNSNEI